MIRELFEAAVSKPPPMGIGHNPQSRALYAIDLLLKWDDTNEGNCFTLLHFIPCLLLSILFPEKSYTFVYCMDSTLC